MENVARLEDRRIDIRRQQGLILEAESASLDALEKVSNSIAACVSFLRDMKLSIVHPKVRELISRIPAVVENAVNVSSALSDCHRLAGRIIADSEKDVVLSGGIPKEERPPFKQFG